MTKLCSFIGATVFSSIGWWLGMFVGIVTAVMLCAVGTGVGIWAGRRFAQQYDL